MTEPVIGSKYSQDFLSVYPRMLSREECQALIQLSETLGYRYTPIQGRLDAPRGYTVRNGRENYRAAIEDVNLVEAIWCRVKRAVPSVIGRKAVVGLNERLRFYRYRAGQYFSPHTDGFFLRDNGERSLLTLILYLNDDYTGGETRFLQSETLIQPEQGQALLFSHQLWHEGLPVTSGCKYVLRTDVIYQAETEAHEEIDGFHPTPFISDGIGESGFENLFDSRRGGRKLDSLDSLANP